MSSTARSALKEVPDLILDPTSRKKYQKGKFMGRGGFARCYELTDLETKEVLAGKIVSKTLLVKQHSKEKMTQEIAIHKTLRNMHIVQFHSFFEDQDNVYILLELCRRRSLMELHKRRKAVTEPEARYFLRQICSGVKHLHDQKIIHRDLKLGNLFLNDDMDVKIGDFGLATRVDFDGERKKTLCGTPNYIAPEVIGKKGHSYEVDTWSTGCILYTLLVGKPPFETSSLKDTYHRIKNNEYILPSRLSSHAAALIRRLLADDPRHRPTMAQILDDPFFSLGYLPPRLPTTCLSMAPRFDKVDTSFRAPSGGLAVHSPNLPIASQPTRRVLAEKNEEHRQSENKLSKAAATAAEEAIAAKGENGVRALDDEMEGHLEQLAAQLTEALRSSGRYGEGAEEKLQDAKLAEDECEAPEAIPIFWVSKWVDYSDKYGLGYQLSDNSCGVLFNDQTRLLLLTDGENLEYIERNGEEAFHALQAHPDSLKKKVTLLKYFRNYMLEHLLKAGATVKPRAEDDMSRLPFLRSWFRTRSAIILHLSNGTLQINFFQDHSKIILEPTMSSVSYIDEHRQFRVFRLTSSGVEASIATLGCTSSLNQRLKYAKTMVERLQATKTSSRAKVPS